MIILNSNLVGILIFAHSLFVGTLFVNSSFVDSSFNKYSDNSLNDIKVRSGIVGNDISNKGKDDVGGRGTDLYVVEVKKILQNNRIKSFPSKNSARYYSFVIEPNIPCDSTTNCSASSGGLPLYCSPAGLCECVPSECWIYTLEESLFSAEYVFTCGKCGELGSECNRTSGCDPPGFCARDGFCHCLQGEHREDVCFVKNSSAVMQILEATLLVVIFFASGGLIYNTCDSYRRNRTLCWCRASHHRRRRRGQRSSSTLGMPSKSPAYTAQQRIMQNFHHSDDSSDDDDDMRDDQSNIPQSSENENGSAKLNADPPSYDEGNTKNEPSCQELDLASSSREPNAEETPPGSSDASGMTEYFNTHTIEI